ncbi:MAG TPA: cytochrome C [Thermoanaerobaculia bacterium]|nr:cytochrome C [Thermoanaerobaculia bacterium]
MRTPWKALILILAVLGALVFSAVRSGAQENQQERQDAIAFGKVSYRVYCQNCHGESGKGNGRLAELLKVSPADLTQISQRNGGTFPVDRMHQIIDGRADVLAHGGREMPVWGQAFLERTDNEAEVRAKVHQLTVFLESIQEKGPAKKK